MSSRHLIQTSVRWCIYFQSQTPPKSHNMDRTLPLLRDNLMRQAFRPLLFTFIPVGRRRSHCSTPNSSVGGKGKGYCFWWPNTGGAVDMDVTKYGYVIVHTFLPMIPTICSSRSGVQRHSVGVRTGDGTMVWWGSPDIREFRRWVLLKRRLGGDQ